MKLKKTKPSNPDVVIYAGEKWYSARVIFKLFPRMKKQRLIQIREGNSKDKTLLIHKKMQEGVHYIMNVVDKRTKYYSLKGIEYVNNHTKQEPAFDLDSLH